MILKPYRQALALPGVRSLLLVSSLARIPLTATSIVLTLYVVTDLGQVYAAAGMVGAAMTIGMAIGQPLLGRLIDRRGLRPALLLATIGGAVFWSTTRFMPYPVLVGAALLGGMLALPLSSVVRQSIAALVPEGHRRQAYALDSMTTELSFMVGPALAVLLVTTGSARATMAMVGGGIVLAGVALIALNPPVRGHDEPAVAPGRRIPRREWFTPRLIGVMAIGAASTLVLAGADISIVAALQDADEVGWTGVVLTLWSAASLVGGFSYGAMARPPSLLRLALLLGICTIPVGLASGQWWLLALALLPSGLMCAPTLTASANAVSNLVPAAVRGEAMGLYGSALTVGLALGAPFAGAVIDRSGPGWGFAAIGALGTLVALTVLPGQLRRNRRAGGPIAVPASPDPASPLASEQAAPTVSDPMVSAPSTLDGTDPTPLIRG
ncbi:MFS transporter [Micromonospora sp. NPDC003197]